MPRTVFCTAFAVFVSILLLTSPLPAVAQGISYVVEDIEVDVTADNAVAAREQAFEEAQVKGYKILAERFLSAGEMENFEAPDINTVSVLVQDYEVTNEKLSAVRYKGTYKIRYSDKAFSGRASNYQRNASAVQRPKILILPFYDIGGRSVLWQANPFMEAWGRARSKNILGRAIVPIGDIEDISQIRDEQASDYDPSRLNSMRLRYQAKEAVILIASPEIMTDGRQDILVRIYNAKPYGPELARQVSVRSYPGEGQDQLYNRVIAEVAKNIQLDLTRKTAVQRAGTVLQEPLTGSVTSMSAQLSFNSVREWVETKRSLERAYGVKLVQVKSLSPRRAVLEIKFQGSLQNFRNALQFVGVGLKDTRKSYGAQYTQTGTGQEPLYQLYPVRNVSRQQY